MPRHKGQSPYVSRQGKRQGTYWTTEEAMSAMVCAAERMSDTEVEVSNSTIIEYCLRTAAPRLRKVAVYPMKRHTSTYNLTPEAHKLLQRTAKRCGVSDSDIITHCLLKAAAEATREAIGFGRPAEAPPATA